MGLPQGHLPDLLWPDRPKDRGSSNRARGVATMMENNELPGVR